MGFIYVLKYITDLALFVDFKEESVETVANNLTVQSQVGGRISIRGMRRGDIGEEIEGHWLEARLRCLAQVQCDSVLLHWTFWVTEYR